MGFFRRKINKKHRSAMRRAGGGSGERVVRTAEGARRYGVPIGTPISQAKKAQGGKKGGPLSAGPISAGPIGKGNEKPSNPDNYLNRKARGETGREKVAKASKDYRETVKKARDAEMARRDDSGKLKPGEKRANGGSRMSRMARAGAAARMRGAAAGGVARNSPARAAMEAGKDRVILQTRDGGDGPEMSRTKLDELEVGEDSLKRGDFVTSMQAMTGETYVARVSFVSPDGKRVKLKDADGNETDHKVEDLDGTPFYRRKPRETKKATPKSQVSSASDARAPFTIGKRVADVPNALSIPDNNTLNQIGKKHGIFHEGHSSSDAHATLDKLYDKVGNDAAARRRLELIEGRVNRASANRAANRATNAEALANRIARDRGRQQDMHTTRSRKGDAEMAALAKKNRRRS